MLEIFTLGITTGTSPTTYDPTSNVNRLQMAAFLSRTVDGVLKRGSRRAALDQYWTPTTTNAIALTTVGVGPYDVKFDGADLWVANLGGTVSRVRASDGRLLETWTTSGSNVGGPHALILAMGRVLVTGLSEPGRLYVIDPTQPSNTAALVASNLGGQSYGIAFDGARLFVANPSGHSVSIVTPGSSIPWTVTTVTTGFINPRGAIFDGTSVWISDQDAGKIFKIDTNAAILQTVTVSLTPGNPVFDGANIWVPDVFGLITVVRASSGTVVKTLTGNGLEFPNQVAFDGQRVLATNLGGKAVSLWKAADLTPLGFFPIGTESLGVCSDGVNFWIALTNIDRLGRF